MGTWQLPGKSNTFLTYMHVKFHCLFHKSQSMIPVLSKINLAPVNNISRSILILSRNAEFMFPIKNFKCSFFTLVHATHQDNLVLCDINKWRSFTYQKLKTIIDYMKLIIWNLWRKIKPLYCDLAICVCVCVRVRARVYAK